MKDDRLGQHQTYQQSFYVHRRMQLLYCYTDNHKRRYPNLELQMSTRLEWQRI